MKCQQSIDDPLSITRCPKKSYINSYSRDRRTSNLAIVSR